ncbi:MAG: hypothetical protein GF331_19890 [Chitinivibrionales bacterium]|nr:hypothetical protein [Chitinivibrionales bacterium]
MFITNGAIHIMKNDGSGVTKICDLYDSKIHDVIPNWLADGYIYWSEWRDDIYRVNVNTKQREVYRTIRYESKSSSQDGGTGSTGIVRLMVSQDGKRGAAISKGLGYVYALDLENGTLLSQTDGGCQGTMTTDGSLILHSITQGDAFPAGITSGNQCIRMERFEDRQNLGFLYAPDQPETSADSKARYVRCSRNSPDHATAFCRIVYQGQAVLYEISSGNYMFLGGSDNNSMTAFDFWLGPFNSTAEPELALDKTSLLFTASGTDPAAQVVNVTNSGSGTLGAVLVEDDAGWLTVAVGGQGNAQTLTNTCAIAGLAAGAYHATVTVSGGGASVARNYTVTLNIGTTVAAPDGISAQSPNDGEAIVRWNDNSDNETGFVIERSADSLTWEAVGQVGAGVTQYVDAVSQDGQYYYRVKAVKDAESSGYSQVATVYVSTNVSLTMTSPAGGESLTGGSVQHITWQSVATGAVNLYYSLDEGETWHKINTDSAVLSTQPRWQNYPWTVPQTPTSTALVKVADYGNESTYSESGLFTIVSVAVTPHGLTNAVATGLHRIAVQPDRRSIRFDLGGPHADHAVISLFRPSGRRIAAVVVSPGAHSVLLRREEQLQSGGYVAILRSGDSAHAVSRAFAVR